MKRYRWQILLGLALILASVVLYLIDYEVFGGARDIFIFMTGEYCLCPCRGLAGYPDYKRAAEPEREENPARKDEYGHRELLQRSGDAAADLFF